MNHHVAVVGPQGAENKKLWASDNPTGAIITFYPNIMDHSDVVVSESSTNHWVFTPVWTTNSDRHPLAGHREFGLTDNHDGTFTFYTRAIDRMWSPADAIYNVIGYKFYKALWPLPPHSRNIFFTDDAAKTWGGLMNNVVDFINSIGGNAKRTTSFSKRVPAKSVVVP